MLIDCSYFISGTRHILNASKGITPDPNAVAVNRTIMGFVYEFQKDFLCKMLGERIGTEADAYLRTKDSEEEYELNEDYELVLDSLKESFADYVFYQILGESNSEATITGLVELKSSNRIVSPQGKMIAVWNRMVNRNRLFKEWMNTDKFPLRGAEIKESMLTTINAFGI